MDINATLFGQIITFAIFVWFTSKFVLPMIKSSMDKRKQVILDGLEASKKGHEKLKQAEEEAEKCLKVAKQECDNIIANANKQAGKILEDSRTSALNERNDILVSGNRQIEQEVNKVKMELQKNMAKLIIQGAEQVLAKSINAKDHASILDKFVKKL
ncbi:MAG TPA: F0F1 ATP synthase subunit B [Candidatus Azoamicus sp.]